MRRAPISLALALLVLATGASAGARRPDSGVSGRVLLGPTCPVERPGSACDDRPYAATLRILRRRSHRRVATARSGADGRFRVRLAPGAYLVEAAQPRAPLPRAPERVAVRVPEHGVARVVLRYDSGIR